jgi:hypothetical protein
MRTWSQLLGQNQGVRHQWAAAGGDREVPGDGSFVGHVRLAIESMSFRRSGERVTVDAEGTSWPGRLR